MKRLEKIKTIDDELGNPDIYCLRDKINDLIENQNEIIDSLSRDTVNPRYIKAICLDDGHEIVLPNPDYKESKS